MLSYKVDALKFSRTPLFIIESFWKCVCVSVFYQDCEVSGWPVAVTVEASVCLLRLVVGLYG